MTKAKHHVLCATRGLFAMDAQKPYNGARLPRNPRKNFFQSVNYLTLLDRFLNDAAEDGRIGAK
jgi:hypothetical protein